MVTSCASQIVDRRTTMARLESVLVLYFALILTVVVSEPRTLVLEDLMNRAGNLLKSYGVRETTLNDAKVYLKENVGDAEELSQATTTAKDSLESAMNVFLKNVKDTKIEENPSVVDSMKGLVQALVVPSSSKEHKINFDLLDGVSLGRSLTILSPYVSHLLSLVVPYFKAFISLIYMFFSAISLTIGFQWSKK